MFENGPIKSADLSASYFYVLSIMQTKWQINPYKCVSRWDPIFCAVRVILLLLALLPKRVFYLEGGGRNPGQWERARARVRQTWGFFMGVYSGTRRTGEGCGPFREKQACRFSVNILFVCLFVTLQLWSVEC